MGQHCAKESCRQVMDTPKPGTWTRQVFFYKGIPFEEAITPRNRVEAIEGYKDIRDDDIIVCTFPKAGTHWAADITRKVLCEGDLDQAKNLTTEAYFEVSPPPAHDKSSGPPMPSSLDELTQLPSPRIIFTHMQLSMLPSAVFQKRAKVIYVYRDPRDIVVSFYYWVKNLSASRGVEFELPFDEFLGTFLRGEIGYGSWQSHYKDFQENAHRVDCLALRYEDMKEDLSSAVSSVAAFLKKDLESSIIDKIADSCTFESMKKGHHIPVLFRKGTVGDWKNEFTAEQSERMAEIIRHAKKEMGLKIDYE